MEEVRTKLEMTITDKNGKILKYLSTGPSLSGKEGYYTDVYKDEDGNLHYLERRERAIRLATYSRQTGDGNMISFGINFGGLLEGIKAHCDEKELGRLVSKAMYSLGKAEMCYKRANGENYAEIFEKSLKNKINECFSKVFDKKEEQNEIKSFLIDLPQFQDNKALIDALNENSSQINEA